MNREIFLNHVMDRAGLGDLDEADRITREVLRILGERLRRRDAELLATELPGKLGDSLLGRVHGEEFGREELYRRLAEREKVRVGRAVEYAIVVCHTIAEALREEALLYLTRVLPESYAPLFERPEQVPPAPPHLHPEHHTLAEGHGGGSRPLYDARPGNVQSQSVVATDNPHADTKLSSARGLTQEREQETIAEGKPGSSRPVSG